MVSGVRSEVRGTHQLALSALVAGLWVRGKRAVNEVCFPTEVHDTDRITLWPMAWDRVFEHGRGGDEVVWVHVC